MDDKAASIMHDARLSQGYCSHRARLEAHSRVQVDIRDAELQPLKEIRASLLRRSDLKS